MKEAIENRRKAVRLKERNKKVEKQETGRIEGRLM
jgi:hypothetical protein